MSHENAHSRLVIEKASADKQNNKRAPSARPRKPDNGMPITSAIRYAVCTQEISSRLADTPAWIELIALATI